jgi:dinuclear metal center YbgI/SA1388 family protein
MEAAYPLCIQEVWDNSGWQIELLDAESAIERVLVSLEITTDTVDEAREVGADLIVEHHPIFFGKMAKIDASVSAASPEGAYAATLIRAGISVYAAHTTFDTADGGMNDAIADALGLSEVAGFPAASGGAVTGVPTGRADADDDGGKWIHPIGRKGTLANGATAFGDILAKAEDVFGMQGRLKSVGDPAALASTVAVCGGAGGDFVQDAIREGVDLYITSDVKHHEAQCAREKGLMLIDAGHWGTEKIFVPAMASFLRGKFGGRLDVMESQVNQDPWR